MNLHGGSITVGELVQNPAALAILKREFPDVVGSSLFRMAQGLTLNQVLAQVSGQVPKERLQGIIDEIKSL